jgi:hypothetical protein
MAGYVRCDCCNRPIPVTAEDVGLGVACPRTRRLIQVRMADVSTKETPPVAPLTLPTESESSLPLPEPRGRTALLIAGSVATILIFSIALAVGFFFTKPDNRPEVASTLPTEPKPLTAMSEPRASTSTIVPKPPTELKPLTAKTESLPSAPIAAHATAPKPSAESIPSVPMPVTTTETAIAPFPHSLTTVASPPTPKPEPPTPPRIDSRGFFIYTLAKRIDTRSSEELEKELLAAREVSLDGPLIFTPSAIPKKGGRLNEELPTSPSATLIALAKKQKENSQVYVGTIMATGGRPDLAGLPFRIGLDALLLREKAQAMNALSKQLRDTIQTCIPSADDPRPNTDDLYATLISGKKGSFRNRDQKKWASPEAVPCIQQMLQAENREVRRMACELLRGIDVPEATDALVKWAVFDTDAGNRAAAVDALRKRDQKDVSRLLVQYVRYPWPRAVEHAAEALVALDCQEALPQLVVAYGQPDPDAPFQVELPDKAGGTYRQEVVRVNHSRNCVMCHAPSFQQTDLVRGAVPNPQKPLPPPTTPSYYNQGEHFVEADVTYLQQDFSVIQPVANPGNWPGYQRYDYFVSLKRENPQPIKPPAKNPTATSTQELTKSSTATSPYRQAIRFAITELSQRSPDNDSQWMADQQKVADKTPDTRVGDVARFVSLQTNPNALTALKSQEFVQPPLSLSDEELSKAIKTMQRVHGATPARLALIAYLDPLTRAGEPANRAKAARLLTVAMGNTSDMNLPTAMKNAASVTGDDPKQ